MSGFGFTKSRHFTLCSELISFAVEHSGQTAFGGFPEALVHVDAGLIHGFHNHIEGDPLGIGQEVGQIAGIHGPHGSYGIALDAGNLNQAANGVTGQTQMMLQCNLVSRDIAPSS